VKSWKNIFFSWFPSDFYQLKKHIFNPQDWQNDTDELNISPRIFELSKFFTSHVSDGSGLEGLYLTVVGCLWILSSLEQLEWKIKWWGSDPVARSQ
jgi:hypothetical protein